MNPKQLACLALLVGMLLAYQIGQSLRNRAASTAALVVQAEGEETTLRTQLDAEKSVLSDYQDQSAALLEFVKLWEPYFAVLEGNQEAELQITMNVRKANMLTLSQRYEQVAHTINNKPNPSLPTLVRASLIFDDGYTKLLNWLGRMERIKPTMRAGRVALSKGSRGDDLRMEATLEVPLKK